MNNASGKAVSRGTLLLLLPEVAYLLLVWSIADLAHLGVSVLFLLAIAFMLTDRPAKDVIQRDFRLWEQIIGFACIATGVALSAWLWRQQLETTEQHPLRLLPMLLFAGAVLWREGAIALRFRWRELTVLFFLGGPHLIVWWLGVPALLADWSAKTAAYLLWYLGFDVWNEGAYIAVSGKSVLVTQECAGSDTITYVLGIAILALFLFPLPRKHIFTVLTAAIGIGFSINIIRIALLALLHSYSDNARFDYWHTSEGAQLFGLIAVTVFTGFYALLAQHRADPFKG